jgi:outer membrane murein-binding lipoprotein Lpp
MVQVSKTGVGKVWGGRTAAAVLAMLLLAGAKENPVSAKQIVAGAQQPSMSGQTSVGRPDPMYGGPDPETLARMQAQRQRASDDDRHKRLVADTDKLLQLATELKTDVDKSSKDELSVAVINKAAEIEKLSHDVKERMKN